MNFLWREHTYSKGSRRLRERMGIKSAVCCQIHITPKEASVYFRSDLSAIHPSSTALTLSKYTLDKWTSCQFTYPVKRMKENRKLEFPERNNAKIRGTQKNPWFEPQTSLL